MDVNGLAVQRWSNTVHQSVRVGCSVAVRQVVRQVVRQITSVATPTRKSFFCVKKICGEKEKKKERL